MRLADAILRRGHLSERALAEVCMTGERPVHLDRCDICAERAVELGRWLDDVRAVAVDEADTAFPQERLAAQQSQILRRLEQLDRPARVIAFPSQSGYDRLPMGSGGIRPAWVGIAAAAGILLGLFAGQFTSRLTGDRAGVPARPAVQTEAPAPVQTAAYQAPQSLLEFDASDTLNLDTLYVIERLVPHLTQVSLQGQTIR